ncbi:MAG: hypothetical protein IMF09_12935 [Proteobacteria bacterium]|nr:hypothetical protein [Pseudomonadota bacterium]
MPDRNSIKNTTSSRNISPVSGTFRIVNGSVIDPELSEYGTRASQEAAK